MKVNRRYIIPDLIKRGNFEAKWRNVEVRCEEVAKTVRKEICGKFRGKKMYDILQSQQDGIDSLLRGRIRFFETDKSGRMTVDDKANFAVKMDVHVRCGEEVAVSEVEEIEREMNS